MAKPRHYKYVIIGCGPGGIQMAYFLERSGRDYLVVERRERPASFFETYPRHRRLISLNKKYNYFDEDEFNMRHDWNSLLSDDPALRFTRYSDDLFPHADKLVEYFRDYVDRTGINVRYRTDVVSIGRDESGRFRLETASNDVLTCDVLMLGLGAVEPAIPDIEGIELAIGYEDHELDREKYVNKRVGIIGQGNSAFETADHLAGVAAFVNILTKGPVRFAWETHFVGDVRAINNNTFDMYQLKSLHAVLSPRLLKIEHGPDGALRTTHEYDYPDSPIPGTLRLTRDYDVIIRCCGWKWVNRSLFAPDIAPETWSDGKYPALTAAWESVNVPDMYFIGGAMQGNDRKSASGFLHGFRYNVQTLARLLESKYEGVGYPCVRMAAFVWDEFADYVYRRVSTSAALFQLFGTLCDLIVVDDDQVTVYPELPVRYADSIEVGDGHAFVLTLEFGFERYRESSLAFTGPSDPNTPSCAAFLHPVIRYRRHGAADEFHFGDSLLVRWDRPHDVGGAVVSYHRDFQRWVCEKLGRVDDESEQSDDIPNGPFRRWTEQEIESWRDHAGAMATSSGGSCTNALRSLPHEERADVAMGRDHGAIS